MAASFRPYELLAALDAAEVEFIVVGGVAGMMHRASIMTQDLAVVHRRTPDNIERLMGVLDGIDAYFRNDLAKRRIRPRAADLAGHGHVLLQTTLGMLDVLCELAGGRGYDELLPHCLVLEDRGLRIRVLDLPTLIAVKTEAGRPKDKVAIPLLIAALEESKRGE